MLAALRSRIRLLPVTLIGVAALAGLKTIDLWQGGRLLGAPIAGAQTAAQTATRPAAGAPTSLVPAKSGTDEAKPVDAKAPEAKSAAEAKAAPSARPAAPEPKSSNSVLPRDQGSFSAAEIEVLQSLSRRREELDSREQGLMAREALLSAAEKRIEGRINELKALEAKLTALADKREEEEEKRLRGLVKVYESMKPADAARIFQELDMPVLLDVAERMKEAKLGPILAQMNPQKARAMTVELAGRRQPGEAAPKTEEAAPKAAPAVAPKADAILPKGKPS